MNDARRLITGGLQKPVKLLWREGRWTTIRTSEEKDKMNIDRDADLKGPSVTQPTMSMCRKYRKGGFETFEGLESHRFRGQPKRSAVVF